MTVAMTVAVPSIVAVKESSVSYTRTHAMSLQDSHVAHKAVTVSRG